MKKSLNIKHLIFSIILIIILFTTGYMSLYYRGGHSLVLAKAFESSKARFVNSEVYAWGRMESGLAEFDEIEKLADRLADGLEVLENDSFSRKIIRNDSIDKIEIIGTAGNGKTVNIIGQLNNNEGKKAVGYISVGVSTDAPDLKLEETAKHIRGLFWANKIKPKINSCITGFFDGRLGYEALNVISRQILKNASARKVNGISDNNLISVSAYSPFIDDNLKVDGKKVNMNLAIRYNSYEDRTYIWLASPVIAVEY
ncbi:MAG: YwmB family TATA-box binding protein [Clostridiaceae bacterium]|nr:YwmB family TATA-box binding protein [Clostridiaceae bacterium]